MSEQAQRTDTDAAFAWPAGAATGIGSLPGTDPAEAQRTVFGELPDLPYLPELPHRGPGAELLGRAAGLLMDLPVELYVSRWRLAARPGRDLRRTHDLLERDLDALVSVADGYAGPLKIAVAGPWTLASGLELPGGGPVLGDSGALRDVAASLAEGIARHVAEVSARVPGARVLLQLDEPSLPAVLAGRIRTQSGLATFAPVPEPEALEPLRWAIDAAGVPAVVHCCAAGVPLGLLRDAGAAAVAADLELLVPDGGSRRAAALDALGEALESGMGLFAGVIASRPEPATDEAGEDTAAPVPDSAAPADAVRRCWHELGLPVDMLTRQVVVTQTCGLAGAAPRAARAALRAGRDTARRLADDPEYHPGR